MLEPASSSESTKQSGGISVRESRHSHSSFLSLSWLFNFLTGSTLGPKAFTLHIEVLLQDVTGFVTWTEHPLVTGFVTWTEHCHFLCVPVQCYCRITSRTWNSIAEYDRNWFLWHSLSRSVPLRSKPSFTKKTLSTRPQGFSHKFLLAILASWL